MVRLWWIEQTKATEIHRKASEFQWKSSTQSCCQSLKSHVDLLDEFNHQIEIIGESGAQYQLT